MVLWVGIRMPERRSGVKEPRIIGGAADIVNDCRTVSQGIA